MDNGRDLQLLLNSRSPLLLIETSDEARMLSLLVDAAQRAQRDNYRALFRWSVTDGLQRLDIDMEPQAVNAKPEDVLRHIRSVDRPGIFALLDFHPFMDDPILVRLIKDICLDFPRCARHLVIISHKIGLPDELRPFSARLAIALPDEAARAQIVRRVALNWTTENPGRTVKTDKRALNLLIRNLAGLSETDTERLAHNAVFNDGAITQNDLPEVMRAKYELLNQRGALNFEYDTARFSDIGGLTHLKQWLNQRRGAFLRKDDSKHLDAPRGVLLIGVQGCGKSLAAKATAGIYGVPLLRLDFGSLYNKYHGETERSLRESLATAEVMSPCVLWIDEIEKGIAGGHDDSGTSRRVLGAFLTWLSERGRQVFVVATANDISALPAELVRKGRFDEIFFVDLPSREVRGDIFRLHLQSRELDEAQFDITGLAAMTSGYSGAEIEQAVAASRYTAHARGEALTTALIAEEVERTRPLAVVMAERVAALRAWAVERTVAAG